MRHHLTLSLLLSLLLLPTSGEAIFGVGDAVFDIAVQWETAITAIQTTAIATNQILDMTPFDELLLASAEYAEDIEEFRALVREGEALAWDIARLMEQWERLFGTDSLPDTSALYALRRHEVRLLVMDGYCYAMRMQTLLSRTIRVATRLLAFVAKIGRVIGNVQVAQTVSEGLQQLNSTLLQSHATRTTLERAQALEATDEISSVESLKRINADVWGNWPGMKRNE